MRSCKLRPVRFFIFGCSLFTFFCVLRFSDIIIIIGVTAEKRVHRMSQGGKKSEVFVNEGEC